MPLHLFFHLLTFVYWINVQFNFGSCTRTLPQEIWLPDFDKNSQNPSLACVIPENVSYITDKLPALLGKAFLFPSSCFFKDISNFFKEYLRTKCDAFRESLIVCRVMNTEAYCDLETPLSELLDKNQQIRVRFYTIDYKDEIMEFAFKEIGQASTSTDPVSHLLLGKKFTISGQTPVTTIADCLKQLHSRVLHALSLDSSSDLAVRFEGITDDQLQWTWQEWLDKEKLGRESPPYHFNVYSNEPEAKAAHKPLFVDYKEPPKVLQIELIDSDRKFLDFKKSISFNPSPTKKYVWEVLPEIRAKVMDDVSKTLPPDNVIEALFFHAANKTSDLHLEERDAESCAVIKLGVRYGPIRTQSIIFKCIDKHLAIPDRVIQFPLSQMRHIKAFIDAFIDEQGLSADEVAIQHIKDVLVVPEQEMTIEYKLPNGLLAPVHLMSLDGIELLDKKNPETGLPYFKAFPKSSFSLKSTVKEVLEHAKISNAQNLFLFDGNMEEIDQSTKLAHVARCEFPILIFYGTNVKHVLCFEYSESYWSKKNKNEKLKKQQEPLKTYSITISKKDRLSFRDVCKKLQINLNERQINSLKMYGTRTYPVPIKWSFDTEIRALPDYICLYPLSDQGKQTFKDENVEIKEKPKDDEQQSGLSDNKLIILGFMWIPFWSFFAFGYFLKQYLRVSRDEKRNQHESKEEDDVEDAATDKREDNIGFEVESTR